MSNRSNRTSEKIGNGIAALLVIALLALFVAGILLPAYLFCRYVVAAWKARKRKREYLAHPGGWWLSQEDRDTFKWVNAQIAQNKSCVRTEHTRASDAGVTCNTDGGYSRRSHLGKEIRENIENAEAELESLRETRFSLELEPSNRWYTVCDAFSEKGRYGYAILAWCLAGAFFYAAFYVSKTIPEPVTIEGILFVGIPALFAAIGAYVGKAMGGIEARRLAPQPPWVDIDNVDQDGTEFMAPTAGSSLIGKFALAAWAVCLTIAAIVGAGKGADLVVQFRQGTTQVVEQQHRPDQSTDLADKTLPENPAEIPATHQLSNVSDPLPAPIDSNLHDTAAPRSQSSRSGRPRRKSCGSSSHSSRSGRP